MSKEKDKNPAGAAPVSAPAGTEAPAVESEVIMKVVSDEILGAISAASGNLKGESFEVDAALETAGKEDLFFNPSLSQYREGLCINTHREFVKIKKVPVGNADRKAWCITCPAGYRDKTTGEVKYDQAFNFYPSTLRKQIQVTDEMGDPVINENNQPVVKPEVGNAVWTKARSITDPKGLLEYSLDKVFETVEIIRDFGPSVFVKQKDDSRKATSHKLTSVPQFNIIG